MNDKCDVIQDLLPLYLDEDLRVGTKRFIDEHLKSCPECRKLWEDSLEGEQLFREVIKDNRVDAISGKRIWYRSMRKYLLKPAFWAFLVGLIGVIIFATIISRPNLLHYEILTTAATAEEMLHPGFFRTSQNRDSRNALKFELQQFSSPGQKESLKYIYRASLVNDSIILDRIYPFIDVFAEIYYPDVNTPMPSTISKDIMVQIDEPAQFSLSFNRFVNLSELKLLFENTEVELLWLGIATRDSSKAPSWSFIDTWGLPVWLLKNNVKEYDISVQDEVRKRTKMLTDYKKYLTGIDPNLSDRLEYIQKNGIQVFGVIVRATGSELLQWLEKYPLVRYYRRLS